MYSVAKQLKFKLKIIKFIDTEEIFTKIKRYLKFNTFTIFDNCVILKLEIELIIIKKRKKNIQIL